LAFGFANKTNKPTRKNCGKNAYFLLHQNQEICIGLKKLGITFIIKSSRYRNLLYHDFSVSTFRLLLKSIISLPAMATSCVYFVSYRIKVNPELDRLRKKALESVNGIADEEIDNLISSTVRIHAGFLFHSPKTLQPLLRAINETNSSATESSWQSFGNKLGLDIQILKVGFDLFYIDTYRYLHLPRVESSYQSTSEV